MVINMKYILQQKFIDSKYDDTNKTGITSNSYHDTFFEENKKEII